MNKEQILERQESVYRKDIIFRVGILLLFLLVVILGAWNTDDGYHAFVMARNFAEGNGLVYNIGERVNAATCPLFVLLLGCVYFFTGHMAAASIVVCTLCSVSAVGILIWSVCRERWQALLAVVLLGTSACFISFTTSGLENSLLFLEEALFLQLFFKNERFDMKKLLQMALLCSFVLITRMDAGILLFLVTAYCFLFKRNCSLFKMMVAGIAGLCPFFAWEVFSLVYYGSLFPNTYDIKINTAFPISDYIERGIYYIFASWGFDTVLVTFMILAVCRLLGQEEMKLKLLGVGICLKIIYIVRIGGDFMIGRHFTDLFFVSVFSLIYLSNRRKSMKIGKKTVLCRNMYIYCMVVCMMITSVSRLSLLQFMWPVDPNSSADERAFYYPTLGMVPMILNNLQDKTDSSDRTWATDEVNNSRSKGYYGDVLQWAPGVLVYKYNKDFYMSDPFGLGDPLLSKLPAVYVDGWRIGHMTRKVPEGYKESLITGKNMITDESLHKYYDILLEVIRGNVFSKERLRKTIDMFLGKYDYLIEKYEEQQSKKNIFHYWLFSEGFIYDGEWMGDYVQVHGNDTETMSSPWMTDLEPGIYDVSMKYAYPTQDADESTGELILCAVKDDVQVAWTVLERKSNLCTIHNLGIAEGENMRLALISGSGEICNVYEIEIVRKQ